MRSRTDRLKPLKDYLEKEGKSSVKEMRGWLSSWSIDGGKLAKSIKSRNENPSSKHVKAIEKWGKNKGIPKKAAYPIAKSIKKKGLQPKSFYNITLKRRRSNMEKQIEKVIFDILNK